MSKEIDKRKLAARILELVGGEENVNSVVHCATRLRFKLKDEAEAQQEKIENLDGVVSVIKSGGQFQVVIGNTVQYVYRELVDIIDSEKLSAEEEKTEGNLFNRIIDVISSIFTPILGVMIGSGIIKGLLMIGTMYLGMDTAGGTYRVLTAASNSCFYFLPVILAYTAAKKFKANPIIAMIVGAALIYPDMITAYSDKETLSFLGIPIIMINYSSSVIPSILSVWFLSKVERFLEKHIPDIVKSFLIPLFSIIVVVPVAYLVIGPIGNYVGLGIAAAYSAIYAVNPIIAGFVLGGAYQALVVFGIHWGLGPIQINNVAVYGFDTITAMYLPAKYAQAGATFAIAAKTKHQKLKSEAVTTALTTTIFGITEPAVYGFTLKYKKPFICASVAGAVGGAISGAFRCAAGAYGISNTLTLAVFLGHGFMGIIIAILVAFIISFILTYLFGYKDVTDGEDHESAERTEEKNQIFNEKIYAPMNGKVIDLQKVADEAFANENLGKSVAILPEDGKIYAPFNGSIEMIFPTKHAVALKSSQGMEVIIHAGINTVEMNGEGFKIAVSAGQKVEKGNLLFTMDLEKIRKAGYDTTTFVVVTNSDSYENFAKAESKSVNTGDFIMSADARKEL